jgi:Tfp pilus assembly protein PilF
MDSPAEARKAFQTAVQIDPNLVSARLALAQLDHAAGDLAAARQSLQTVLAASPANTAAVVQLATLEETAQNHDAAIENYQKALKMEPEGPLAVIALNNLAYRLAETRNALDEALTHAQRAKELAPDNRSVDDTLGWIYYRKGIYSTALPYLQAAATSEIGKRSALVQYHLALCQIKAGQASQARQTLSLAKSLDPKLPEAAVADQLLREAGR